MKKDENRTVKLPKPLPYQKKIIEWLDDDSVKYVTFVKSRQSGGSFLNKMLVAKWGLSELNMKIGYITPTAKLGKRFFLDLSQQLEPFIKGTNATELLIEFKTGSYVQFFSAESKDAIRGFQFHYVIIDEAAFMDDETFNLIIRPTFTIIGKKIILTSTTNGAQGFFYAHNVYGKDDTMRQYRTMFINIYDNPFISEEDRNNIKRQVPDKVWRQEYMSEFLDGSGTVFTNYMNCINLKPEKTGVYYAAIDWGKTNDYTVLTIINNKKQVMEIFRINAVEYTKQVDMIVRKLSEWKPREVISEENNIGAAINEMLKAKYKGKVKSPYLTNKPKRDMIEDLIVAFEQQLIGIPKNEMLISELQAFTCIYNPQTQSVRYQAPNGMHDDMVLSLAYAYSCVNKRRSGSIRIL